MKMVDCRVPLYSVLLFQGSKALGKGKAAPVASIFGGADDDEDEAS